MARDTSWISVLVKRESHSGKAWLLNNGHRDAWVPKALILDEEDELGAGVETKVELPAWLAEEKDLV